MVYKLKRNEKIEKNSLLNRQSHNNLMIIENTLCKLLLITAWRTPRVTNGVMTFLNNFHS